MTELIIGGSGYLGSKLANSINKGDAYSTYFNNKSQSEMNYSKKCIHLDLRDKQEIINVIKIVKPSLIIHCGGITDTDLCEKEKDYAYDVNVSGIINLMNLYDRKIIYFSSDYVFDGNNPPYSEQSEPNPINYYGLTKLQAEKLILSREENLVVRVSGLFGINAANNKFLERLNGKKVFAYTNLISSPTYIDDVVSNLPKLINSSGIIHLSSYEGISRYNFSKLAMESLGLSSIIKPTIYNPEDLIAKRPYNTTMTSSKNLHHTSLESAFNEMKKYL